MRCKDKQVSYELRHSTIVLSQAPPASHNVIRARQAWAQGVDVLQSPKPERESTEKPKNRILTDQAMLQLPENICPKHSLKVPLHIGNIPEPTRNP